MALFPRPVSFGRHAAIQGKLTRKVIEIFVGTSALATILPLMSPVGPKRRS